MYGQGQLLCIFYGQWVEIILSFLRWDTVQRFTFIQTNCWGLFGSGSEMFGSEYNAMDFVNSWSRTERKSGKAKSSLAKFRLIQAFLGEYNFSNFEIRFQNTRSVIQLLLTYIFQNLVSKWYLINPKYLIYCKRSIYRYSEGIHIRQDSQVYF